MSSPRPIVGLSPTATQVWGIEPTQYNDLRALAQINPATEVNKDQALERAKSLAAHLTALPNLLGIYNSNASEALRTPGLRKDLQEAQDRCHALQSREQEFTEVIEGKNALLDERTADLRRTQRSLDDLQRTNPNPGEGAPTDHKKYASIPDPPHFSEGRADYRTFKSKLKEKLRGDGHRFRDPEHQMSYAVGFLKGKAYRMVEPLRESGDIDTIEHLFDFLDATYDDPDKKGTAERELQKLKQGTKEFSAHLSEFQSLMAVLRWDERAKRAALYNSLSEEIKDVLASTPYPAPEEYMPYVRMIQHVDQQLRARSAEKRGKGPVNPTTSNKPVQTRPAPSTSTNPRDSWDNPRYTGAAPMDLSGQRRTPEQQALYDRRRTEGACTSCGSKDHWRRDCNRRRPPIRAAATTTVAADITPAVPSGSAAAPAPVPPAWGTVGNSDQPAEN